MGEIPNNQRTLPTNASDEVTNKTDNAPSQFIQCSTSSVEVSQSSNPSGDADNDTIVRSSDMSSEYTDCDGKFLTLCFILVLSDWAYVATLLLNLLLVSTVPYCCFSGVTV